MTDARDRQHGGDHYKTMGVQPWDVIDTWPLEQRIGFYRGNLLKYTMRMNDKDAPADNIGKAEHYAQKLREVLAVAVVPTPKISNPRIHITTKDADAGEEFAARKSAVREAMKVHMGFDSAPRPDPFGGRHVVSGPDLSDGVAPPACPLPTIHAEGVAEVLRQHDEASTVHPERQMCPRSDEWCKRGCSGACEARGW